MNALPDTLAPEAETVDLCRDDFAVARKAKGSSPDQGWPKLRWSKATVRTIDSRRDDLERTHWKKVWRSMVED
jgi:hypothetical protein